MNFYDGINPEHDSVFDLGARHKQPAALRRLSGCFFSDSESSTSTETTNVQETRNLELSDLEGTTIADSEDIELETNIEQVDEGLIDSARDISIEAFDTSRSMADDANALAGQAIRANEGGLRESLDFGSETLETTVEALRASDEGTRQFAQDALIEFSRANESAQDTVADVASEAQSNVTETAQRSQESALGFVEDIYGGALATVRDTTRQATGTLANAIGDAAAATRSDATDVLNNIVRYGGIALGIAAVGGILYYASRGS